MGKTGKICYGCCFSDAAVSAEAFVHMNSEKKTKNVIWGFIQYLKLLYGKEMYIFQSTVP